MLVRYTRLWQWILSLPDAFHTLKFLQLGESGRAEYYLQNLRTSKNKKKLLVSDDPSLVKQLIYVKYKHVLQPRSQCSLLPALPRQVGENPRNEVACC